jgi:choline dehydrogenase-like flavoprotein
MIIEGKDISSTVRENVDVCIIGSGAGGAFVARELARQGHSVVVLEEGRYTSSKDFDGSIVKAFNDLYRNQGMDATFGIPALLVPTGKCLGGTTVINMGTCFRAPEKVLESWQEMGLENYGPDDMAPYYDTVEEEMNIQSVKPEIMGKGGKIIAEGARKLGLNAQPMKRNVSDDCKGCGNCAYGCMEDAKQSMIVNVIPEADKLGVKFYCDTKAQLILNDKETVTGVHGEVVDRETRARHHSVDISAKIIVICAGALNTPAILLNNKICNKSGQVGKNLKLHLMNRTIGVFEQPLDTHRGVCQNLYIDDYIDEGIMLEATFTGPESMVPGLPGIGQELWDLCKQYRHMACLGIMTSEKSSGRIRADGDGDPIISFSVSKQDSETLFKSLIIADRVLFSAGAKKVVNGNFAVPEVKKMSDLDKISRMKTRPSDWMLMAAHPQGSCRMGVDPKKSVVGPTGECHDLQNLFIADASVFPTSLGVNPQETIWAIASRVSEAIHNKL